WLEDNCPPSIRRPGGPGEGTGGGRRATYPNPEAKLWLDRMAEKGWTAPTWPKEYGGGGLDKEQAGVLAQEMRRINARPAHTGMGLSMIGPALLEFGNEEQKHEHLPKIVRGEIWWCQGYSEPGSGSDLASLQTRAVEDGDDYVINGSKIWTSGANFADWMFCLVRTDPDAPKHEGISFILFDMETPGVTVKPIQLISGASPFCETFLDDVRVPKRNVVGELNKGWTVGKRLLQYERTSIGGGGGGGGGNPMADLARRYIGDAGGHIGDPELRKRLVAHRITDRAFGLTVRRNGEELRSGGAPTFLSSMFKLYGTEQNKARYELMLDMMGSQMLGWEGDGFDGRELSATREWLRSLANSIEGGTSEVQLNIIAKRILGLPD
ncbi:MAG: acyl-CoA dehydrogenase family protein, partial [Pseudomonadales bacterium]|nr:acyl-CoA dehydrogenase family protein [Pseudomonadales bacterium]